MAAAPVDHAAEPVREPPPAPPPAKPTEDQLRSGKHLGLTTGELPEVVSEELIRAIAAGKVKLDRVVDPKHAVIVDAVGVSSPCTPGDKKCEKANASRFKPRKPLAYLQAMVKAAGATNGADGLTCTNEYLVDADPSFGTLTNKGDVDGKRAATPLRYATCSVPGPAEYAEGFHVLFVPDATRGVRLAAVVSSEVGSPAYWLAALQGRLVP